MMEQRDRQVAQRSVLLSKMPPDTVELLLSRSSVKSCDRGALLFVRGEVAHSIFVVVDGWVKLTRTSSNGEEVIVGIFTNGGSFGEGAAFQNDVYPVAAEAVTDCRVVAIPARSILEIMDSRPELCRAMLAATFKHLHELVAQVEQLKAKTGAQRVAEFLIELCPAEKGSCTVTLPYEKVLIAGRLGMKPESLSRAFGRLKTNGVTIDHNHAFIEDVVALKEYIEKDRAEAWGHPQ